MTTPRTAQHPILPMFTDRWSPRAFSEKAVTESEILTLLEAARWAPSASNLQPWRFIYSLKGTPEFDQMVELLVPFNQGWAKSAAALIFTAAVTTFDGERPIPTHAFDAGAAWMSLALQAHSMGLSTHGMGGVEFDKATAALNLPDNLKLIMGVAVGYQGDPATLSEKLQAREMPSDRQPLEAMAFKGTFSGEIKAP
ncbi:nitroreductase family protein [Asticcacaulis sp. ZE23SCel15]|uniref:nitroreductase family protein n=1 Tax=Asticcacaulis sp. ZE23SCel15 TaxID=3059027 RepID=UPI0026600436|nr:nitroreductase family protein [Asticcacaulis sp. ZE23SCel15]WKL58254.1 nitroreductase family protein [Asticcacaulis sp. ZE23SCel15]